MNRSLLIGGCTLLAGLLIWMGLTVARADLATTASASTGPATTVPTTGQVSTATQPANPSTTQSTVSVPAPVKLPPASSTVHGVLMPRVYAVLLIRSMFVRGHVADPGHEAGVRPAPPPPAPSLDRAESGLVFNGVTQTAQAVDALVEDTASGRVITVHAGDAIAKGKVGKITFDTLEYLKDGRGIMIQLGQTLAGGEVDPSTIVSTTEPAGSGASPEDILERLRQKRLAQLGVGK
jgi:hypothetical protein